MQQKLHPRQIAAEYMNEDTKESVCVQLSDDIARYGAQEASDADKVLAQAATLLNSIKGRIAPKRYASLIEEIDTLLPVLEK